MYDVLDVCTGVFKHHSYFVSLPLGYQQGMFLEGAKIYFFINISNKITFREMMT